MHFFHSLNADDIGNSNLSEKVLSKNNSTCENAVAQKYGRWMMAPGDGRLVETLNFL